MVGVVAHGYRVPRPFGELSAAGTPLAYIDGLVAAGARPVLLPGEPAADLLDLVDAVILTGGGDVDPTLYGGDPACAREVDPSRDTAELAAIRAASTTRLPLLGVCRGHQLLAVATGGTLSSGLDHVSPFSGHRLHTAPGSTIATLVGARPVTSALHNQAVATPGQGWRASAWAADGTVEAIEPDGGDWPALGVQWHPELAWSQRLDDATGPAVFGWLVARAEETRSLRDERGDAGPPELRSRRAAPTLN